MATEEKFHEAVADFCTAVESACVNLKRYVSGIYGVTTKEIIAAKEETFNSLRYEKQHGDKLGDFEVAYKRHNIPEKFSPAFGILNVNNSTIQKRYSGSGYEYSYWIYGDNVYRKKFKGK